MARKDALLRLRQRLLQQRDELRRTLKASAERERSAGAGTSDLGDMASDDTEREMDTQLMALESRELVKIEKALVALRKGKYGTCEVCQSPIPMERLQALPYTPYCIGCQRKLESKVRDGGDEHSDWGSVMEFQSGNSDREFSLRDIQFER